MSRIGKVPIALPKGVEAKVGLNHTLTVKGPKGVLSLGYRGHVAVKQQENNVLIERPSDGRQDRAYHGLYHRLITNMVTGVSEGFEKKLQLVGVGYRAQMDGKTLVINAGYSHDVRVEQVEGIKLDAPQPASIVVSGIDKQKVGQVAAEIRAVRPPEPYKGKGIRYEGEHVRRKVGKTGA
jgi:large subunit ribosomal protein L6